MDQALIIYSTNSEPGTIRYIVNQGTIGNFRPTISTVFRQLQRKSENKWNEINDWIVGWQRIRSSHKHRGNRTTRVMHLPTDLRQPHRISPVFILRNHRCDLRVILVSRIEHRPVNLSHARSRKKPEKAAGSSSWRGSPLPARPQPQQVLLKPNKYKVTRSTGSTVPPAQHLILLQCSTELDDTLFNPVAMETLSLAPQEQGHLFHFVCSFCRALSVHGCGHCREVEPQQTKRKREREKYIQGDPVRCNRLFCYLIAEENSLK